MEPVRGVVLLTHGLNGHPASLDQLARELARSGLEVFRPAFTGHEGDMAAYLAVQAHQWESDARRFHGIARARAHELGVPLHHLAYSMSGLIFQVLRQELVFNRRVYLAPALAMHPWFTPAITLASALPWLSFRSRIPEGYGANPRSGVRAYLAFDHFYRRFRTRPGAEPDAVPTAIWMDPEDELVNEAGIRALAEKSEAWEFHPLRARGFHHLCLDEASLGTEECRRVFGCIAKFLLASG